jgi:pilus assembly protein CpaE
LDPFDLQVAQGIRPQELYNVLQGLQRMFDVLVVDVGSPLTENTVTLMDMADRILVVTTPDLASIQDTTRYIQVTRSLTYPNDKLYHVLNRVDMEGGIKTKDISPVLNQDYFPIPDGGPNVLRCLNRGVPLVIKYPRNQASRAVKEMANQFSENLYNPSKNLPGDGM